MFDANDMRNMGGLRKQMPVTFWVYLIGALALSGIFPLAGFWSKDEILADAFHKFPAVFWLLLIAAFFTAFYMGRQIWMVFFGQPRHPAAEHAEESPRVITVPLIILAALSVLGGLLNFPGLDTLTNWLEHTIAGVEAGQFNLLLAGIALILAFLAIYLSWLLYGRKPIRAGQPDPLKRMLDGVFTGMERKWLVDEFYQAVIIKPYMATAAFLADVVDWRFWHDWFHEKVIAGTYQWLSNTVLSLRVDSQGIDASSTALQDSDRRISGGLRRFQNGFVRSYALAVLFGVVIIVGYLLLK